MSNFSIKTSIPAPSKVVVAVLASVSTIAVAAGIHRAFGHLAAGSKYLKGLLYPQKIAASVMKNLSNKELAITAIGAGISAVAIHRGKNFSVNFYVGL